MALSCSSASPSPSRLHPSATDKTSRGEPEGPSQGLSIPFVAGETLSPRNFFSRSLNLSLLERNAGAVPGESAAAVVGGELVDGLEEVAGGLFRGEEFVLRDVGLEGFGEAGVDGAGVEADADLLLVSAGGFDGEVADQHVEGGFGGAIAVPAAEAIVFEAADAGGECCEDGAVLGAEERQEVLGDEGRADGVEGECFVKVVGVEASVGFFGFDGFVMQDAGGADDEVQGRIGFGDGCGVFDRGLVGEIELGPGGVACFGFAA